MIGLGDIGLGDNGLTRIPRENVVPLLPCQAALHSPTKKGTTFVPRVFNYC